MLTNHYNHQEFECPESKDTAKSKIFHHLVQFYSTLPQKHPSSLRASQNLNRQFGKQGPRAQEQEQRYWKVMMQEFLNYLDKQEFESQFPEFVKEFDEFVGKLKAKTIQLDPRFSFPFKKSLWASLESNFGTKSE